MRIIVSNREKHKEFKICHSKFHNKKCYAYDQDENGELNINFQK